VYELGRFRNYAQNVFTGALALFSCRTAFSMRKNEKTTFHGIKLLMK